MISPLSMIFLFFLWLLQNPLHNPPAPFEFFKRLCFHNLKCTQILLSKTLLRWHDGASAIRFLVAKYET